MTELDAEEPPSHDGRMQSDSEASQDKVEIKALVEAIVRALVDHPDAVRVTEIEGAQSCVLELAVAPEDIGKVIGKKGVHADAIRRIVHAVGGKNRKRYVLEILENR
jgi:predicted RNA-binding protein YlqC (UPF0109 family)